MFSKVFVTLAVLAISATAQDSTTSSAASSTPSSIASLSPCILSCLEPAATLNNCSFTDISCACGSAQFQADATACLKANCSPADLATATALQQAECGSSGITPSGSVTTTHSIPFSTAASNSTGTGSSTGTGGAATTTPTTGAATTPTAPAGSSTGTNTAPTTSPTSGANGIVANFAFIGAAIAGLLAL